MPKPNQTRGKLVGTSELAEFVGVTTVQVRNWIKEGIPIEGEPGKGRRSTKFWSADALRWLVHRQLSPKNSTMRSGALTPQASPKDALIGVSAMEAVKLLNIEADTRLKDIKLSQLRGELASIEVIEAALSKVGGQICAVFETIPVKIRRRNPKLTATDLQIVQRELTKALNIAASIEPDLDDIDFEPGISETTT